MVSRQPPTSEPSATPSRIVTQPPLARSSRGRVRSRRRPQSRNSSVQTLAGAKRSGPSPNQAAWSDASVAASTLGCSPSSESNAGPWKVTSPASSSNAQCSTVTSE
jgi:hypothetical protein